MPRPDREQLNQLQQLRNNIFTSKSNYFLLISFGIFIFMIFLAVNVTNHHYGRIYFVLITVSGACGGILNALRSTPHRSRRLSLECYNDVLYGIIGAYLAFWIMPGNYTIPKLEDQNNELLEIKILLSIIGISIIGGYIGRELIEKVSGDLLAKYKDLERKVSNTEADLQNMLEIDIAVSEVLDLSVNSESHLEGLINLFKVSNSRIRRHVYYRVKNLRYEDSLELIHIYKKFIESKDRPIMKERHSYLQQLEKKLSAYQNISSCLIKSAPPKSMEKTSYTLEYAFALKDKLIARLFANNFCKDEISLELRADWRDCSLKFKDSLSDINQKNLDYYWIKKNLIICDIMQDQDFYSARVKSRPEFKKMIVNDIREVGKGLGGLEGYFDPIFPIGVWIILNEVNVKDLLQDLKLIEGDHNIAWWKRPEGKS